MSNILTQQQVVDLAIKAGFTPENAQIASAIALCEAPFTIDHVPHANFDAIGDQQLADAKWGFSYGAFQIRSLRADKGTGRWRDELKLVDPLFNTKAARQIKLSQGWTAWTTYKNGQYEAFLPKQFPPPPNSYTVISGDTLSGIASRISGGKWIWQELAAANGILGPKYTITVGQVLLLPVPVTPGV
jgi:nucleoid-associated protein YgaU